MTLRIRNRENFSGLKSLMMMMVLLEKSKRLTSNKNIIIFDKIKKNYEKKY